MYIAASTTPSARHTGCRRREMCSKTESCSPRMHLLGLGAVSSRHTRAVAQTIRTTGRTHDNEHERSSPCAFFLLYTYAMTIHRLFDSHADLPPGAVCRVDTRSLLLHHRRFRGLGSTTHPIGGWTRTRHEVVSSRAHIERCAGAWCIACGADLWAGAVCRVDTQSLPPRSG